MGKAHPLFTRLWKSVFFLPSQLYYVLFIIDQAIKKRRKNILVPYHKKTTISIGNITLGGSGKTMVGLSLAKYLVDQGLKVAVVLRGYKGRLCKEDSVLLTERNRDQAGDEGQLYYDVLKKSGGTVFVGKRKDVSWKKSQETGDIVLLDDGFQRRDIPRDIDILCFDSGIGLGNGALFPAGYLRQPLDSAADVHFTFFKTSTDNPLFLPDFRKSFKCQCFFFQPVPLFLQNLEGERLCRPDLSGETVLCFCAIGNADSFFTAVKENIALQRVYFREFSDHLEYSVSFLKKLEEKYSDCFIMICTQKDFVKIRTIQKQIPSKLKKKLYFLGIDIKIYSETSHKTMGWQDIDPLFKFLDKSENHAI